MILATFSPRVFLRVSNLVLAFLVLVGVQFFGFMTNSSSAQETLPADNGPFSYHTSPQYRESETHPVRVLAYALHPIGWVLREAIFRPVDYLISSSQISRSVFGYREPFDFRQPECFSGDDTIPDCRSLSPFNYNNSGSNLSPGSANEPTGSLLGGGEATQVFFPNVNFDFNARKLSSLGKGRAKQIAELLSKEPALKVVLQGHTDYIGSDEYNMKLGMDRAEAVRGELIALGVSAERLSTVSFGEAQPLFKEEADWARAINRRVEVHTSEGGAAVDSSKKVVEVKE